MGARQPDVRPAYSSCANCGHFAVYAKDPEKIAHALARHAFLAHGIAPPGFDDDIVELGEACAFVPEDPISPDQWAERFETPYGDPLEAS